MMHPAPVVDPRRAIDIYLEMLVRRPGFVPDIEFPSGSPGALLGAAFSSYLETVLRRLNQAPEKHKLAFLELFGIGLQPAQSARVPLVFRLNAKATGGAVPAGTPASAPPAPGTSVPIQFETERSLGLTAGKIAQIVSLHPGRDEYLDHTADFNTTQAFRLFDPLLMEPTPHHLYLSHSTLLALNGNVQLGIEFDFTHPSAQPLELFWEYWDGKVWRGFETIQPGCARAGGASLDGTSGLTRSGTVLLATDCAEAGETTVDGRKGFWLRGRLTQPLPVDPGQKLPEVESIRISSTVSRPLRGVLSISAPPVAQLFALVAFSPAVGRVTNASSRPVEGAVVTLVVDQGGTSPVSVKSAPTSANGMFQVPASAGTPTGFKVTWAGMEFGGPDGAVPVPEGGLPRLIELVLAVEGLQPDKAFADATELDVTKPFYPMGLQPQPGTVCYLSHKEILSKPGAKARIYIARTRSPQDETSLTGGSTSETPLVPIVAWEYWNGRGWAPLPIESSRGSGIRPDFNATEIAGFTVPDDLRPVTVNDEEALWIRMRIESGTYGFRKQITFSTGDQDAQFTYVVPQPPVLSDLRLGYAWQFGPFFPEQVLTYNDFEYQDHTEEAIWPGTQFLPFQRLGDRMPALYLGFDKKPPVDRLGLYFDIVEETELAGPELLWEYWNGLEWRPLPTEDETARLRRTGLVSVLAQPNDSPLARFGTPLHWLRAHLKEDGPPGSPLVSRLFANAVWAAERQTLANVLIGVSRAVPGQVLSIAQTPVLAGERIEVRELSGARAGVEWRTLAAELAGAEAVPAIERLLAETNHTGEILYPPLRIKRDRRDRINEVWVGWQSRRHLHASGPRDRHYTLDRALGLLQFGDGVHGLIPPAGAEVNARSITSGGGLRGNVAADTVTLLVAALPGVEAVFNPRAAEGGANGQTLPSVLDHGPQRIRHRGRAVSAADYEALAREASSAVAFARATPLRSPEGIARAGWVSVLIVPHGDEARPFPSFGLREHVRRYIEDRTSADLAAANRIAVIGPQYEPVDVDATIAPRPQADPGAVERAAVRALGDFLHPIRGGPEGLGWELGRDVYLSDVAAVLEAVEGADYVQDLALLRNGVPQGERFPIGDDRIAIAGQFTLNLRMTQG